MLLHYVRARQGACGKRHRGDHREIGRGPLPGPNLL